MPKKQSKRASPKKHKNVSARNKRKVSSTNKPRVSARNRIKKICKCAKLNRTCGCTKKRCICKPKCNC